MSAISPYRVVELGDGYASTPVNTAIFRHHGLLTRDQNQFAGFYDPAGVMRLVRRDLRDDSLQTHDIPGKYRVDDAHNVISLGIDPAGYLHLAYDHHGDPLRYRRSRRPMDISDWTEPRSMTGQHEAKVTYPYFIMWPRDAHDREGRGRLDFLYREHASGNGDLCLKRYHHDREIWSDHCLHFLKGTEQKPWTTNAYWNHPAFDARGGMVLTWTWRVHQPRPGCKQFWYNHHVGYARTEDGRSWYSSHGLEMNLPMTPVNAEVIWPTTPACNLLNQCSSAMDSRGRLHVVYYAGSTLDDPPQYRHLWQSDAGWRCDAISDRTARFALQGPGSLKLPISRPDIVIDDRDRIYVIYQGDLTDDRLAVQRLDPPDYTPTRSARVLWDETMGHTEPIIDRFRWARDGVLSILVQRTDLPDGGDHQHPEPTASPVRIIDWRLDAN